MVSPPQKNGVKFTIPYGFLNIYIYIHICIWLFMLFFKGYSNLQDAHQKTAD